MLFGAVVKRTALAVTLISALLLLLLLVASVPSWKADTEAPQVQWSKTYGYISGVSIVQVNDTDLVIAAEAGTDWYYFGHSEYDYTNRTGVLFKIDLNGDVKWRKQLPVSPVTLIATRDGGFAIAGWTRRPVGSDHLGLPIYGYFISLVETDSEGNVLWNQPYENQTDVTPTSVQRSRLSVNSVVQTNDGGFVLGGTKQGYEHYDYYYEAWLMKTDSSGNMLWINYYGVEEENDGTMQNGFQNIVETDDKGFLFAGYLDGAIIVKTDSMGKIQWTKTYNDIRFGSMLKTKEGDFVFAGYQGRYEKAYVMKLDAAFNIVWNRAYEDYSSFSIEDSVNDGYLFTNFVYGGHSLIKTDLKGNIEWTYNSNCSIRSAIQTKDGAYALTGNIEHPDTPSRGAVTDIMVERLASKPSMTPLPTSSPEPIETWLFTTILVASFVIIVVVVGIGLLFYFKKRKREVES